MKRIDRLWMEVAIAQAYRGTPAPNPHVGAIIVNDGALVGVGHHERAGEAHAEIVAIRAAGDKAAGATLYTTLEPCNHYGRTPPCVDAIVAAGIRRVVIGALDPNREVAGGGAEALAIKGVEVITGVRELECLRVVEAWTRALKKKKRSHV
jgi:diaminohydroxyphosphoribosylaminopyrimidine deaminase/5-amino-6-(5-phosphoribosylamino)uracil reductase